MQVTYNSEIGQKVRPSNLILLFALILLLIDQLSKWWIAHTLPLMDQVAYIYPYGGIGVFKNLWGIEFSITHMTNTGAAWGVLGHYQFPLLILRIGLISGIIIYLFFLNRNPAWILPLSLILAGAIGNVLDYFIYGHVIDMLHFILWGYDFAVFNVADSLISLGIGCLILLSWIRS